MLPLIVRPSILWDDSKAPQPLVTKRETFIEVVEKKRKEKETDFIQGENREKKEWSKSTLGKVRDFSC